jgi:glycine C-acetyltransferase
MDQAGLLKPERILASPQGAVVKIKHRSVLNLCANNYLGLANDSRIIKRSLAAIHKWGAGVASVRFICGTQEIHKELEREVADYLHFDDSILFSAAFDANGGVFEPLLGEKDVIVSDSLNHASIIDGVRLSKAARCRFMHNDMNDLECVLRKARAAGARTIVIVTDGVFSMDGTFAQLDRIVELAERFDAVTMVDDCHATGIVGWKGMGTPALFKVADKIDIVSGTFGKALGGAMGGFIAARQPVVELLRQQSRPYLFSNALAPALCGASLAALEIARGKEGDVRRVRLMENAQAFRKAMAAAGFRLLPGEHPIIPIMLNDAKLAQTMAAELLDAGILAAGFSFPVVPKGRARIRTQMSAELTPEQVEQAALTFTRIGRKLRVI